MTLKEVIDMEEIKVIIREIVDLIEFETNIKKNILSSEKTLVYRFAWLLNSELNIKINVTDFERVLFDKKFSDGKYLDLFLDLEIHKQSYRIGLEFKFPNKKDKNSGGKEVRQKIINDIKRLDYLISKDKIDLGVFICATNEKYYPSGKIRDELNFDIRDGKKYKKGENYPVNTKNVKTMQIGTDFKFKWKNKEMIKSDFFSFLEPIFIEKKDD